MNELQNKYSAQIEEVAATCSRIAQLGYVTSHGGNISMRCDEDVIAITPTKLAKRKVGFGEVCLVRLSTSETLYAAPGRKPTGELPFHARIFLKRPDVRGIVHGHPAVLTGFAIAGVDLLERAYLPEPVTEVGPMPLVPYYEPLRDELADAFEPFLPLANGFLMENHGALTVSHEGCERALDYMEMYEAAAQSILVARQLGSLRELPRQEIKNLERTIKTRNLPMPGLPGAVQSLLDIYK